mgnify:CR=1 FL=1
MNIEIHPKEIFIKLLCFIFFLLLLNFLTIISRFYFGYDFAHGLVPLFNFGAEKNIPTLYSSLALLTSSLLLMAITLFHKRNGDSYYYWQALAIIFFFLCIDETAMLHEKLIEPVRESLNTSGLLYFAWVIPYGLALLVLITTYINFLRQLPNMTMILFLVSGATFILGAIGFELFGGRHFELYGNNNATYALFQTCEESLEMLGIAIFIYTLLTYIVDQLGSFQITLKK